MQRLAATLIPISLVALLTIGVACAPSPETGPDGAAMAGVVGILPLQNYAPSDQAVRTLLPILHDGLAGHGIEFIEASELRPMLRERRIRSVGQISRDAVALLREGLGLDYLLMGSIDIYDQSVNEVAVTLRILETRTGSLVAATSAASTGEEFRGLFQTKGIEDTATVARLVLRQALDRLARVDWHRGGGLRPDALRIAIVPFESVVDIDFPGQIVSNILLPKLLASGYVLVEPGYVTEVFLAQRTMDRGRIDWPTLQALRQSLGVDYVITGTAERLAPLRGNSFTSVPDLAMSVRMLDTRSQHVLAAWEISRRGDDGEWFLGMGRTKSIGRLIQEACDEVAHCLAREFDGHHQRKTTSP